MKKKLIFFNNYYINNTPDKEIFEIFNQIKLIEFKNIKIEKNIILKLIPLFKKKIIIDRGNPGKKFLRFLKEAIIIKVRKEML